MAPEVVTGVIVGILVATAGLVITDIRAVSRSMFHWVGRRIWQAHVDKLEDALELDDFKLEVRKAIEAINAQLRSNGGDALVDQVKQTRHDVDEIRTHLMGDQ
jgi:hypothetical protein